MIATWTSVPASEMAEDVADARSTCTSTEVGLIETIRSPTAKKVVKTMTDDGVLAQLRDAPDTSAMASAASRPEKKAPAA